MGSLSRQNARNRLFNVLDERLDAVDQMDVDRREYILNSCIDALAHIAIDTEELDRVSQELATDDSNVEFPSEAPSGQEAH